MYRPSFDSSLASPQPNQGYSPINSMNLDMDMENLFLSQDLYAGPGFGQGSGSGIHFGHGNQDYYQSQDGSNPVEDDSPIEKVHPSKLRRVSAGGFNLNEEAKGYEEELQEERPIGRDRAKKKASSSSRSTSSAVAGGGLVELVADKWKSIKSASWGKKKEQQDSYIQLKNRELDL
ncbi:hypothetical protein Tco_1171082 [Tanacetum coccineum]